MKEQSDFFTWLDPKDIYFFSWSTALLKDKYCCHLQFLEYNLIMNQRHYSPDQLTPAPRLDSSDKNSKKLREGGSTTKLMQSTSRYCEDEIVVGDYCYRPSDQIGAGYSSRVYRALGKDGQEYAMKVIEMRRFSASGLEMLQNEIDILRRACHPNVIKLHHVHRTQNHTYLVTELCREGDLLEYIARKGRLSEEAAGAVMAEVIQGVKYLMRMGVIHRDLKPANILRGDRIWKIADFGFSIKGRDEVRTRQNVGTPLYMPIQSLLRNVYSPESDIFAVGVMYYELLVGVTPWQCRSEKELIKKLASVPFAVPQKYHLSSHIKFLLHKMCAVDKTNRMTREEFCELNLKNFVSLNHFNDPTLKDTDRPKKNSGSPAKIKKSRGKGSKEKDIKIKVERQYKIGRRKKSTEKPQRKKSAQKDGILTKPYALKEEGSAFKNTISITSLLPSSQGGSTLDRFDIINEKILNNQLDYCRFMYYFIQNRHYLPLAEQSLKRVVLIVFKHLVKISKQLTDIRINCYRLPNWDTFKITIKYKGLAITLQEYCEKYEREYLRYLKESEINVIKDVNQKFSQLGSAEPLSLPFYHKLKGLIASALKDCLTALASQELSSQQAKGKVLSVKSLLRYYKWIDDNVKNYEKYAVIANSELLIIKNYKNCETNNLQVQELIAQIQQLP